MEKNTVQNRVTPQGDVFIDGIIGDPADGLTSAILIEEIDALGDIDLHVFINSPGGDVFQGLAIFNRLANHSAGVSVEILGLAASMASVIAMSGDTITMPSNAMLMIHDPWTIAIGNAKDLRTDAAKLDMVKKSLVGIYTKKTGLKASEIEAMMQAETWLDAEQALAKNFIDQITEPDRMAACIDLSAFKFKHPPKEYTAMAEVTEPKEPETRAEKKRASGIMASIKAAKLGVDFATELIDSDLTLAQARDKIINQLADDDSFEINGHINALPGDTFDNPEFKIKAMAEGLAARYAPITPSELARAFAHMSTLDMARECLEANGLNTRGMSASRTIQNALTHSAGDFPNLLTATGDRILRQAYEAAPAGVKAISRSTTAVDFRAKSKLKLGEAPALQKVLPGAEYKHGTMLESKESYSVATYGTMFGIDRQALVNDDLGAFADASVRFGRATAEFEAKFMSDLFLSNPKMEDGTVLFHANHGNLASSGSVLTVASLDNARAAMRLQKGLDGKTPINTAPRYLLVPAALETIAQQMVAKIQPTTAADANPFSGQLEVIVEPRLDATSSTAWFLVADFAVIDTLEHAWLESTQGPEFFTREGWSVDGIEFKVRDDFGGGILDWRGFYKNAGV